MSWRPALLALLLPLLLAQEGGGLDPKQALARLESEERAVLEELREIDGSLWAVELSIYRMRESAAAIEAQREAHLLARARAQTALDAQSGRAARLVAHIYRLQRRGFARIVFSAEDPSDLRRRLFYLLRVLGESRSALGEFRARIAERDEALGRLDENARSLAALQTELRLKESRLQDDRAQRQAFLDELRRRKGLAGRIAREREQAQADLDQRLPSAPTSAAPEGPPFAQRHGALRWPVTGGRILRAYGAPDPGGSQRNLGVDLSAPAFTPVRAVADGEVSFADNVRGYGLTLVVAHDSGYSTVYAHLGSFSARKGQRVREGEKVGTAGETGVTDTLGPRVHFEVRYHNNPQDPMPWLDRQDSPGSPP